MIKLVFIVRRRPELSVEEFRKYWMEKHGPLVQSLAKALRAVRYVQSHTLDVPFNAIAQQTRGSQASYDGITEVWWNTPQDLATALASAEGQAANLQLVQDEARFCDLPKCSLFFTEEHTVFEG